MSCYASALISPARGSLSSPPARRSATSFARTCCLPRWSGGEAAPSMPRGKKAWCSNPGGSSPGWMDFTKPAPSAPAPPAWVEPWDYTQVMMWCIDDTVGLLKKNPPPPLGVHNPDALIVEYENLSKCAETEAVEIYAGTQTFLKLQVKTWQCYGENVRGYKGGKEASDLMMTVREATVDHVIRQRLLSRFGMKMDNMPDNPMEHDLAAAMMYSTDATRDVVGKYRRKQQRIKDRRSEGDAKEYKDKEDGDLGLSGV